MISLVFGILKGAIIGGGLGYGFYYLGLGGSLAYVLYGLIGALTGIVAGKPFWRHETIWTPVVKAVFGAALGMGIYALVAKGLGDPHLPFIGPTVTLSGLPHVLGAVIGILFGIFVELDDRPARKKGPG